MKQLASKNGPWIVAQTLLLIAALLILIPATSYAEESVENSIKQAVEAKMGNNFKVTSVSKTNLPGLFEVYSAGEIYYTDKDAKHWIIGKIIDLDTKSNLTDIKRDSLNKVEFKQLPFSSAIKIVKGNGKRVIALYADPLCGFCRQFHNSLKKVDNITVYVFQLNILSPESKTLSRNIWCAKDKVSAYNKWMEEGTKPAEADTSCQDTHEIVSASSRKHFIRAVPTIIFQDGSRVGGAMNEQQLEERFKKIAASNSK